MYILYFFASRMCIYLFKDNSLNATSYLVDVLVCIYDKLVHFSFFSAINLLMQSGYVTLRVIKLVTLNVPSHSVKTNNFGLSSMTVCENSSEGGSMPTSCVKGWIWGGGEGNFSKNRISKATNFPLRA